ncbi:MAG: hemolysin XhlA family protein [Actinobacteria bacterium]|nr:hemolysin XhlA family protein [Actinomycetota bacterium]
MTDNNMTSGEIRRILARIDSQLARIDDQMVSQDVFKLAIGNVQDDIKELKSETTWGRRAMVTALLFPILVMVIGALVILAVTS